MQNNFPYKHVFFVGCSMFSIQPARVKVKFTLNKLGSLFNSFSNKMEKEFVEPTYHALIDGEFKFGRCTNGKAVPDYIADNLAGLPFREDHNFAYAGAGYNFNYIDHFALENIPKKLGWKKLLISDFEVEKAPSINCQFKDLVRKQTEYNATDDPADSLVIIMLGNNDLGGLTYLAGMKKKWTNLSQKEYLKQFDNLRETLPKVADASNTVLMRNIEKTFEEVGIKNYIAVGGAKLHQCPMFHDVKKNFKVGDIDRDGKDDLAYLIDSMYKVYSDRQAQGFQELNSRRPEINAHYIHIPEETNIPQDKQTFAFLDYDGKYQGRETDLRDLSNKEQQLLNTCYFLEPMHMSTTLHKLVANEISNEIIKLDPNFAEYSNGLKEEVA